MGKAGAERTGEDWKGGEWIGKAGLERRGKEGRGLDRKGRSGMDGRGGGGSGAERQEWTGAEGSGMERKGKEIYMQQYIYRAGFHCKVPAQVAGEEIEKIRKKYANIKTVDVVDAARPKKAPLHPAFNWDDANAAELYRLFQARVLIRKIRVISPEDNAGPGPVIHKPAFIHVRRDGEKTGYYQTPDVIVAHLDEFQLAMSEAIQKLTSAKQAVDELEMIAKKADSKERLAMIIIACRALETANGALRMVH